MADTERTSADLLTNLFQDGQPASSITAQDMRDYIVSVQPQHGAIVIDVPAVTTISVAGTYVKAAGTTVLAVASLHGFSMPVDNRLRYDAIPDRHAQIITTFSVTCASNNQDLGFKFARDGAVVDDTEIIQRIGTGTDKQSLVIAEQCVIAQNGFLELWVANLTSTANLTVENMYMIVQAIMD